MMNNAPIRDVLKDVLAADVPPATAECGSSTRVPQNTRAFSLIEILMTVALLSVIILGLVAMFDQTRRAFTSSMTQVDVLEGGRATTAIIASDLEQLTPAYSSNVENFFLDVPAAYSPVTQPLTDPTEQRTNTLQELYFVTRNNQQWSIIGYRVDQNGINNGLGTLYRYSLNNIPVNGSISASLNPYSNLLSVVHDFTNTFPTNSFSRLIDGVVDFRVRAFDPNGNLIPGQTNFYGITAASNSFTGEFFYYRFMSNTIPAFVEVELGILETRTLQRYYSMTNANNTAANAFLANHAGQVHMFRQRIPIRAVDPTAYPGFTLPALP